MADPLQLAAGTLRHKIQIQTASSSRDAYGQPSSTWALVLTARAKIEGTTSATYKELIQDGAIASQATDAITIRWPGSSIDIKPGMRVLFGDNTFLIQVVDNVQRRNRVVRLLCMAIDSDSN